MQTGQVYGHDDKIGRIETNTLNSTKHAEQQDIKDI